MSTSNFPTSLDTYVNPAATDNVNAVPHHTQHTLANDSLAAVETVIGITGSADTNSINYKLSGVTGSDKAVSKTGVETLTNKTLTSPSVTGGTLTTPAIAGATLTGTIDGTGATVNLTDNTFSIKDDLDATKIAKFQVSGISTGTTRTYTLPDANTTITGIDTTQTLTNKTMTGANNTLTASLLKSATTEVSVSAATAPSSGQVLTATSSTTATWQSTSLGVTALNSGIASKITSDASTSQTIAHGLGLTPKYVKLTAIGILSSNATNQSIGSYNGTNSRRINVIFNTAANTIYTSTTDSIALQDSTSDPASSGQTGVVTVDGTNITITWTKHGTPGTFTYQIFWEAQG